MFYRNKQFMIKSFFLFLFVISIQENVYGMAINVGGSSRTKKGEKAPFRSEKIYPPKKIDRPNKTSPKPDNLPTPEKKTIEDTFSSSSDDNDNDLVNHWQIEREKKERDRLKRLAQNTLNQYLKLLSINSLQYEDKIKKIHDLQNELENFENIEIATIVGSFFGMIAFPPSGFIIPPSILVFNHLEEKIEGDISIIDNDLRVIEDLEIEKLKKDYNCENIKEKLLAYVKEAKYSRECIQAVADIDCQLKDGDENDSIDWNNLNFCASMTVGLARAFTGISEAVISHIVLSDLNNLLDQYKAQNKLNQQLQNQLIENQIKAIENLQKTLIHLQDQKDLHSVLVDAKKIVYCSYGYRGDSQSQIITFEMKNGKNVSVVIPTSSNIPSYLLPNSKKEQKNLFTRDKLQAKTDAFVAESKKKAVENVQRSNKEYQSLIENFAKNCKNLEQKQDKILSSLEKKGIHSYQDKIPDGCNLICDEKGNPLRDEQGNYFNDKNQKMSWNAKENAWYSTDLKGNVLIQKPGTPKNDTILTCASVDDFNNKPTILTTPTPQLDESKTPQGCGNINDNLEPKTDTGHSGSLEPEMPENKGCGNIDDKLDRPLFFEQKKPKESKLAGEGLKPLTDKEIEEQKKFKEDHPNGLYDDADYHRDGVENDKKAKNKKDETSVKSPRPKDGQKALDNSYDIQDSPHRIAIEDNKYVILYCERDGVYHGFVCDKWKNVPDKAQEAFKKHKLVHPKKCHILKK